MGIGSVLAKGAKSAYRFIRYGKQVGKTAKNGSAVYKKGGVTTGLSKDGKVIRQIQTRQTGKNTTETVSKTPIPFSEDYRYSRRITTNTKNGSITDIFRCRKSPNGYQSDIYDTPWNILYNKARTTGKISGCKDTRIKDGCYNIRTKFNN